MGSDIGLLVEVSTSGLEVRGGWAVVGSQVPAAQPAAALSGALGLLAGGAGEAVLGVVELTLCLGARARIPVLGLGRAHSAVVERHRDVGLATHSDSATSARRPWRSASS